MILINKNLNVVIILLAIVFVSACAPSEEVKLLQAIVEAKENDDPVLLDKITNGGSVLSKRSNLLDGKFYEVVLMGECKPKVFSYVLENLAFELSDLDIFSAYLTIVMAKNMPCENVFLLQNNINFDLVTPNGTTLVHLAVHSGDEKILQRLLKRSTNNINNQDVQGNTPLDFALIKGNQEMIDTLLRYNAKTGLKKDR